MVFLERRWRFADAAVLAMWGVVGLCPVAVQASAVTSVPAWTRQHPAVHPSARTGAAVAYDMATGTVVLFGGGHGPFGLGDTWTWDGSTWAKQATPAHPPGRTGASMAYDAATGTVVLFGGWALGPYFGDTWTWDGTTWTKQAPAASPPARFDASMAYDPATGTAVLFGGFSSGPSNGFFGDTWAWDGTTWTKQVGAASPHARELAAMAYDAATGTVVLFGGDVDITGLGINYLADTWTWG